MLSLVYNLPTCHSGDFGPEVDTEPDIVVLCGKSLVLLRVWHCGVNIVIDMLQIALQCSSLSVYVNQF